MTATPTLATFYQGWEIYNRSLIAMVTPLTPEQLAQPLPAHQWTVGMLLEHLIANRAWWFHIWMGEGDASLAAIAAWDPAANQPHPTPDAATLVTGLNTTWALVHNALEQWTAADLATVFDPPAQLRDDEQFPSFSRQWIIWHTVEHEIHHGGELSIALGLQGLPGIYGTM